MIFLLLACATDPVVNPATGVILSMGPATVIDGVYVEEECVVQVTDSIRDYSACCSGGTFVGLSHLDTAMCAFDVRTAVLLSADTTLAPDGVDHWTECMTADGDLSACCPEGSVVLGAAGSLPYSGGVYCGWP